MKGPKKCSFSFCCFCERKPNHKEFLFFQFYTTHTSLLNMTNVCSHEFEEIKIQINPVFHNRRIRHTLK